MPNLILTELPNLAYLILTQPSLAKPSLTKHILTLDLTFQIRFFFVPNYKFLIFCLHYDPKLFLTVCLKTDFGNMSVHQQSGYSIAGQNVKIAFRF